MKNKPEIRVYRYRCALCSKPYLKLTGEKNDNCCFGDSTLSETCPRTKGRFKLIAKQKKLLLGGKKTTWIIKKKTLGFWTNVAGSCDASQARRDFANVVMRHYHGRNAEIIDLIGQNVNAQSAIAPPLQGAAKPSFKRQEVSKDKLTTLDKFKGFALNQKVQVANSDAPSKIDNSIIDCMEL